MWLPVVFPAVLNYPQDLISHLGNSFSDSPPLKLTKLHNLRRTFISRNIILSSLSKLFPYNAQNRSDYSPWCLSPFCVLSAMSSDAASNSSSPVYMRYVLGNFTPAEMVTNGNFIIYLVEMMLLLIGVIENIVLIVAVFSTGCLHLVGFQALKHTCYFFRIFEFSSVIVVLAS